MKLLEKDIKVQVDRGSVSKPENRKVLQQFGKIWKAVYGKLKTSPDKINKYKGLIKRISNTSTSNIDKLAGVFEFMGKKFRVEVDKAKYNEMRPTPWRIAYVENKNLGEHRMKKSELRQIIREVLSEFNVGQAIDRKKKWNWISSTLVNDESSSDNDLLKHFMNTGKMDKKEAEFYVKQRNSALKNSTSFKLKIFNG